MVLGLIFFTQIKVIKMCPAMLEYFHMLDVYYTQMQSPIHKRGCQYDVDKLS